MKKSHFSIPLFPLFSLLLLSLIFSQRASSYMAEPVRDINEVGGGVKKGENMENFKKLEKAKLVYIDIPLIKKDFPETKYLKDKDIEKWVISQGGYFSEQHIKYDENVNVIHTNDPIATLPVVKKGYRPSFYGRASILPVLSPGINPKPIGYFDLKGTGAKTPENRENGHNNGFFSMTEALKELHYSKMINRVLEFTHASKSVVGIYAIIDPYINVKNAQGETYPAAIVVRQAHKRHFENINGNKPEDKRKTGWLTYDERLKTRDLLNKFGIQPASHNPAITASEEDERNLGKYINIQGTLDEKYLFDFGHYSVIPGLTKGRFQLPLSHWSYELSIRPHEGESKEDHLKREKEDIDNTLLGYIAPNISKEDQKRIREEFKSKTYSPESIAYIKNLVTSINKNEKDHPDRMKKLSLLTEISKDPTYYSTKDNPYKWSASTVEAYLNQNRNENVIKNHIEDMDNNVAQHLKNISTQDWWSHGEMAIRSFKKGLQVSNPQSISKDELKESALLKKRKIFMSMQGQPILMKPNLSSQSGNSDLSKVPENYWHRGLSLKREDDESDESFLARERKDVVEFIGRFTEASLGNKESIKDELKQEYKRKVYSPATVDFIFERESESEKLLKRNIQELESLNLSNESKAPLIKHIALLDEEITLLLSPFRTKGKENQACIQNGNNFTLSEKLFKEIQETTHYLKENESVYKTYSNPKLLKDNKEYPLSSNSDPLAVCKLIYGESYQYGEILETQKYVYWVTPSRISGENTILIKSNLSLDFKYADKIISSIACYLEKKRAPRVVKTDNGLFTVIENM